MFQVVLQWVQGVKEKKGVQVCRDIVGGSQKRLRRCVWVLLWPVVTISISVILTLFWTSRTGRISLWNNLLDCPVMIWKDLTGSWAWMQQTPQGIIFQQDNDPKHTCKKAQNWFQDHDMEVLLWSAQYPDLNPIEHRWNHLKRSWQSMRSPPREFWNFRREYKRNGVK